LEAVKLSMQHTRSMRSGWFAVDTGYKKEKVVLRQRHKKGVTSCIPILAKTRRYTRKEKQYMMPLISCYVFVYISGDQKRIVLETEYVHGFVPFNSSLRSIS
jgi:hypothetical protein